MNQEITYDSLSGVHSRHLSQHWSEPDEVDVFAFLAARPEWMADAACKDMDTNDFYPSRGDSRLESTVRAKTVCGLCPVREDCLEYALSAHPTETGIWAGLSEKQRKVMRVRDPRYALDRKQHGTRSRYNAGCRCNPCRTANAQFAAKTRRTRAKGAA